MQNVDLIKQKFETLCSFMDERMRRLWAAAEAQALGRGGITAVAAATGLSRTTITQGMREQQGRTEAERSPDQMRRPRGFSGGHSLTFLKRGSRMSRTRLDRGNAVRV